jgi:benzoyl-CoA reductase/2-hydroxyglutaryl-CoA dehydratase subunit BcrC/BadD/HgdB
LEELVPLALIGGPLCATQFQLLDVIEAAGGRVALNGAETGERSLTPSFEWDGNHDDPFTVLADGYFKNIVDVFQRPNAQLYSWMKSRLGVRRVRGIILWQYTGCDLWRAETETLRESFGLPVLTLEAGTEAKPSAREVNRIQAFLETLK